MKRKKFFIEYHKAIWLNLNFCLGIVFLYAPILILVVHSFNNSRRNIVWRGFTLKYYEKAFGNSELIHSLLNSLTIAFISTFFSLLLGFLAAYALWKYRFPFKAVCEGAMGLPIVIPEITMGVAMMVFFNKVGWPTGWIWPFNLSAIIAAHISFCFPFAAIIIRARLNNFNIEEQESAKDLGASSLRCLFDVVFPFLKPAILSAGILCFTLSIDDFVITFFVSTPETVTFPIKVYSMVRFSVTPEVNAISTVLILVTFFLLSASMLIRNSMNKNSSEKAGASLPG